jgi:MFS family permease
MPVWRPIRWRILALLFLITVINFVDRQTLSVVAPTLRDTFHLSNTQYGFIGSALMAGMLLAEFPMGYLMDKIGVREGLSLAVVWWSIATALHAAAGSFLQVSLLRFWMGTGECGNFSGAMKVVSDWFPARERAFATGIFNSGSMIGNVIAVPVIAFLFGDLGSIGGGWASGFLMRIEFTLHSAPRMVMGFGAICCLLSAAVAGASSVWLAIAYLCGSIWPHSPLRQYVRCHHRHVPRKRSGPRYRPHRNRRRPQWYPVSFFDGNFSG